MEGGGKRGRGRRGGVGRRRRGKGEKRVKGGSGERERVASGKQGGEGQREAFKRKKGMRKHLHYTNSRSPASGGLYVMSRNTRSISLKRLRNVFAADRSNDLNSFGFAAERTFESSSPIELLKPVLVRSRCPGPTAKLTPTSRWVGPPSSHVTCDLSAAKLLCSLTVLSHCKMSPTSLKSTGAAGHASSKK